MSIKDNYYVESQDLWLTTETKTIIEDHLKNIEDFSPNNSKIYFTISSQDYDTFYGELKIYSPIAQFLVKDQSRSLIGLIKRLEHKAKTQIEDWKQMALQDDLSWKKAS